MDEAFSQKYDGRPMNVEFRIGRIVYKRCHFAVETAAASFGENWLFPSEPLIVHEPRIIFIDEEDSTETVSMLWLSYTKHSKSSNITMYKFKSMFRNCFYLLARNTCCSTPPTPLSNDPAIEEAGREFGDTKTINPSSYSS